MKRNWFGAGVFLAACVFAGLAIGTCAGQSGTKKPKAARTSVVVSTPVLELPASERQKMIAAEVEKLRISSPTKPWHYFNTCYMVY